MRVETMRYSIVAVVLHWTIAALLLAEVALGLRMTGLRGSQRFAVFQLHKSIGITLLLLVAVRLVWRLVRTPPAVDAHGWERGLAYAVHALFYLLLFALPLSGWTIVSTSRIVIPTLLYGTVPLPHLPLADLAPAARAAWNGAARFAHVNLVLVLYGLFALHLAGALKHQWVDRDGGIGRMAPGVRPGRFADPRLALILLGAAGAVAFGLWSPAGAARRAAAVRPNAAAVPPAATLPVAPAAVAAPSAPPAPAARADQSGPGSAAASIAPAAPAVTAWAIQPSSTLRWTTTWSGETIAGGFSKFDGKIVFAPDALDRSHVVVTVDTASVFSGDAQRDETLHSADWFATAAYPTAIWTATRFRRTAPGRYVAAGTLRLKGVTLPVPVTFALTIDGDTATMRGKATIDRTAFAIGEGEFSTTTDIPAAVALDLLVTARRL